MENSTATALALAALILIFGPVSGAHLNPAVSAADWVLGRRTGTGITTTDLGGYAAAQIPDAGPRHRVRQRRDHHDGCGDACPVFPGRRYEDWQLDDQAGQGIETVRPIRDEIHARVRALVVELLPDRTAR